MKSRLRNYFSGNDGKSDSILVSSKIFELEEFKSAEIVLAFLSTKNEIDCQPIIEQSFLLNKIVAVPRVRAGTSEMDFFILNPNEPLKNQIEAGAFGIREPLENREIFSLENIWGRRVFVVTPGLAFTADGKRLGKGRGFYDRYILRLKSSGADIFLAGYCFPFQIVEEIPTDEHDESMDWTVLMKVKSSTKFFL